MGRRIETTKNLLDKREEECRLLREERSALEEDLTNMALRRHLTERLGDTKSAACLEAAKATRQRIAKRLATHYREAQFMDREAQFMEGEVAFFEDKLKQGRSTLRQLDANIRTAHGQFRDVGRTLEMVVPMAKIEARATIATAFLEQVDTVTGALTESVADINRNFHNVSRMYTLRPRRSDYHNPVPPLIGDVPEDYEAEGRLPPAELIEQPQGPEVEE